MSGWRESIFRSRGIRSWLLIACCLFYVLFAWIIYTFTVDPLYGAMESHTIGADSGTYFEMAGLADPTEDSGVDEGSLVNLGGSSLGPVVIATIFRTTFGVACCNILIFIVTIWWAGLIPGVRREVFVLLLALNAQTLPTLMTLNKEILATAGLVAFSAYVYVRKDRNSRWLARTLLLFGFVFSVMARWVQIAILLWYIVAESRWSPLRQKPRKAVFALLLCCSAGYAAVVNILHVNLEGFVQQAQGGGTITRLYHIQEMGGYILVAAPKILMNLAGRMVTPSYFLGEYWETDFYGSWQNQYLGFLSNFAMVGIIIVALWKNRLRLSRPLIHVALIYFIFTAINPFIQPRYMYPGYAVIALELSRRRSFLEPVHRMLRLPPPPSYYYDKRTNKQDVQPVTAQGEATT